MLGLGRVGLEGLGNSLEKKDFCSQPRRIRKLCSKKHCVRSLEGTG